MNIVVVSDFAHVNGGNAVVALGSALGLAARGHAVTLFSGAGPVDDRILASSIAVICTDQYSIADDPRRLRAMAMLLNFMLMLIYRLRRLTLANHLGFVRPK